MNESRFKMVLVKDIQTCWPDAFTHPLRDGLARAGATQGPRPCDIVGWHAGYGFAIELKLVKHWPARADSIALDSEKFTLNQAASLEKIQRTGNVGVGIVWFKDKSKGVDFCIVIPPRLMRQNFTRHEILTKFQPHVRENGCWPISDMLVKGS